MSIGLRVYCGSIGSWLLTGIILGLAFELKVSEQTVLSFFTLPAWFGIWAAILWRKP